MAAGGCTAASLQVLQLSTIQPLLRELVDVQHQTAAEVGRLVLRDYVLATETLEQSAYLVVSSLSFCFVLHLAYATHRVAGCLGPVAVLDSPLLCLAYSFK